MTIRKPFVAAILGAAVLGAAASAAQADSVTLDTGIATWTYVAQTQ